MDVIRQLARVLLPSRVRETLGRLLADPGGYWSARRISKSYARYYVAAQKQYRADGHVPDEARPSLAALGVMRLYPDSPAGRMPLPSSYLDAIGRIQRDLQDRLSWSENSWFHPPPARLTPRTDEVEEVRRGDVITLKLRNYLGIDGLEDVCGAVMPEIERAIYGAYVLVDKVYVQRTFVSRHREAGSWLWHYDKHPLEVLKLLIYLTDVDDGSAPFTYLSARDSESAVLGSRHPLYGSSRMSDAMMQVYSAKGYRPRAVTGPAGTTVLFNDNVIHRATFAERRHRDVLILQLRPTAASRRPYVDSRWTGSFAHLDFNRDPEDIAPELVEWR